MKKATLQYTLLEDRAVLEAARKKAKASGSELSVVVREMIRDYIAGPTGTEQLQTAVRPRNARTRKRTNLTDLKGLGKEIWDQEDAQEYVHRLRDEWAR